MKKPFKKAYKQYDTTNGFGNPRAWRSAFYERMGKEDAQKLLETASESPYSILGIKPRATKDEIKAAFRKLITEWHPDRNPHRQQEAEEMSKKIIAAYTLLTA